MTPSGQSTVPELRTLLAGATLAGDWTLDAAKSTVGLRSRSMWGLAPVKGVFGQVTGHGTVSSAGEVSGTITIAAASIETKNAKRDEHLRSADFFQTDTFPYVTFRVDRLQPTSQGATVTGQLTVHGRARPVTFPAKVTVLGSGEVRLEAKIRVNRADFGLTWNQMGMASMVNTITVDAVFDRGRDVIG
jgi:polyisoprenoid-binding protein YceI